MTDINTSQQYWNAFSVHTEQTETCISSTIERTDGTDRTERADTTDKKKEVDKGKINKS